MFLDITNSIKQQIIDINGKSQTNRDQKLNLLSL